MPDFQRVFLSRFQKNPEKIAQSVNIKTHDFVFLLLLFLQDVV
jgi:hypothetical protein